MCPIAASAGAGGWPGRPGGGRIVFDGYFADLYLFAAVIYFLRVHAVVPVLVEQGGVVGLPRGKNFAVGHFDAAVGIQRRLIDRLVVKATVDVVAFKETVRLLGEIAVRLGVVVGVHGFGLHFVTRRLGDEDGAGQHFESLEFGGAAGHALAGNVAERFDLVDISHGLRACRDGKQQGGGYD